MATKYWIGASGSQSWATGANWSDGSAPATGDTVYIVNLASDIDSGLAQGAVALAALYRVGGSGTVGVAGDSAASLRIDTAIFQALAAFSGGTPQEGGPSLEKYDFGTSTVADMLVNAAAAGTGGRAALQIKGGASGSKLKVTAGSVDFNVIPGQTGAVTAPEVTGGVLTLGPGVTVSGTTTIGDAGNQSSPTLVTYCSVGAFDHQAGNWYAFGNVTVGTGTVNGNAFFNNRKASGDTFTGTLTVDGGGVIDFRGNPAGTLFTNAVVLLEGAAVHAYQGQLQLTGPAAIQFLFSKCSPGDVTLDIGQGYTGAFS